MIVNIAPGALVRDPVTKLALEDGASVDPNDPYIARALVDRDLIAADAKAADASEPSTPRAEEPTAPSRPARAKDIATSSNEDQA